MVFLEDHQEVSVRMDLDLARSVSCLEHALGELLSQALDLQDAECVLADRNETLGALLRAESTNTLQGFITNRGNPMLSHVAVAEPRFVRKGNHCVLSLLPYLS